MGNKIPPVQLRQELILKIPRQAVRTALLSVPKWDDLNGRGGIVRDRTRAAAIGHNGDLLYRDSTPDMKPSYDAHLKENGLSHRDPLIVIGARNLGNNLRIVAYKSGKGLLQVFGENADQGQRIYYCLCCMESGSIEAHTLRFSGNRISFIDETSVGTDENVPITWALSGQPLLWNGETDLDTIILNTYDLRHHWFIKSGGGRFGPREEESQDAEDLITTLVDTDDIKAVKQKAAELELPLEENYFHSAFGVTEEGDLIIVQTHGAFELIAKRLYTAGAVFAIELDEGGSVSTHFVYQQDEQDEKESLADSRIIASPYFRDKASALLIFKLAFEEDEDNKPTIPTVENWRLGIERSSD